MLKKGNRDVLSIFGYENMTSIHIEGFSLETDSVFIGEDIAFSFPITAGEETKVRLEKVRAKYEYIRGKSLG